MEEKQQFWKLRREPLRTPGAYGEERERITKTKGSTPTPDGFPTAVTHYFCGRDKCHPAVCVDKGWGDRPWVFSAKPGLDSIVKLTWEF